MMTRILTIFCLAFCTMLRAASLPVSFNTTTHLIAAPLDLWTVNAANIYNGLGLSGMSLQSPSSVAITGGTITGVVGLGYTANPLSQFAATTSAQLAGVMSDKTGSGALVFGTSPTLITPSLGTPSSVNLSNGTSLPISTGVSGLGTGVATALATPSSANIFAAVTDETGSGSLVGSASPTFTGTLGAATITATGVVTGTSLTASSNSGTIGWSDAIMNRGAANRLDLRNSTAAQQLRVYNTFSDINNGEWFAVDWQSVANECLIGGYANGIGSANRALSFTVGGTRRWQINGSSYHLYAMADNAYDIGTSAANRPRTIYAGTSVIAASSVQVAAGAWIGDATRSIWRSPSDGVYTVSNHGETDFDRIQYGGTSSSFPAHKRNGTTIETKLADNSGFAATQSLYDRFGSGTPEGAVTAPVGAVYHRTDGGAGTSFYVKESGTGNTGWVAK